MILGIFIIGLVIFLLVNYFKNLNTGEITSISDEDISLPTNHIVSEGEDLWSISEKYYNSGYNWVDIADENNIENPNMVKVGQDIIIPNVTPIIFDQEESKLTYTDNPTPTLIPTIKPTNIPSFEEENTIYSNVDEIIKTQPNNPIKGNTYTVVKGDTLWDIAVRAYGDGFRWKEIAEANKLVNPSIIHRGNVFVIPR